MSQIERNTNTVRKINLKVVLIGVVVTIAVIVLTVLWRVNDSSKRILAGKVIDASTNTAIKGAKVYLENTSSEIAVTDSEGGFSIEIKEETDAVRFLVRAEGFVRYNGVSRLSPGTTLIEIRLKPF